MDSPSGTSDRLGLIGGIGLTEVHVYAQRPAPDGQFSGCPHVHAVVDEGYFVLQGRGAVEFHDLEHGYRRVPLSPGQYVHFPPLILHRLISEGDLVILGMMGSAGLAERGEARIYFGQAVDEDAAQFAEWVGLPKQRGLEGALDRRDASVRGYQQLMEWWKTDRERYFADLRRFIDLHCREIAPRAATFHDHLERGPLAWACRTADRLDALPTPLASSEPVFQNHRGDESAFGMCGVLRPMLRLKPI